MSSPTIHWTGTATAITSLVHTGDTRAVTSLLRRERILLPDGTPVDVPVISGNSWRGRLRRTAELLLRDTLHYEGLLSVAAAAALTSGGALTKTSGEPLSGERLRNVRELIPVIGIFGAATGGRIIDGCLHVSKLIPLIAETAHLTGHLSTLTAYDIVQIEQYTRADDTNTHNTLTPDDGLTPSEGGQMLYRIETIRPGTRFACWLTLNRPTALQASFFADVLDRYQQDPRIGGRLGTGHGHIHLDLTMDRPLPAYDWACDLTDRRTQALEALECLT